jgi:hypothetical protein
MSDIDPILQAEASANEAIILTREDYRELVEALRKANVALRADDFVPGRQLSPTTRTLSALEAIRAALAKVIWP